MRITNKIFLLMSLLIVVVGATFGLYVKNTFVNDLYFNESDFKGLKFQYCEDLNNDFNNSIKDFNELNENSPYTISVEVSGERIKYSLGIRTTVKVLNIFKDDSSTIKKGDTIFIFEPCAIQANHCYSTNGYIPMVENKQYVVFLKDIIKPSWYKYKNEEEKKCFIPSSIFYGKYTFNDKTKSIKIKSGNNDISCMQLLDYDLALLDGYTIMKHEQLNCKYEDIISRYDKIKKDVLKYINKS